MASGMLVDLTKCIGCRGCQVACKQWHSLPAETTHNRGSYQNPPRLSERTWTLITFHEVEYAGKFAWVFAKRQCMHCQHPACASACTVGALRKSPAGPVVYENYKCIGCRYCQYACPYQVPGFEWQEPLSLIGKCDFCADRQAKGMEPACAKTCATGALTFGERGELLRKARERMTAHPETYVDHIYGEHEAGGASMLYLSALPFDRLGFPSLGKEPIPRHAEAVMKQTPTIAIGVAAVATGLYWVLERREKNQTPAPEEPEEEKP